MAMNINNLPKTGQVNQQSQLQQKAAESSSNVAQERTARTDSVSLTPQAKHLGELQKKATDEPVMNQKKMDEIKKAIASGEYKVDPEKLAKNMMSYELDLLEEK